MRVKNVSGSSRFPAPRGYNSWLEYWEKQSGRHDLVGAHVQKVNSADQSWYITPICKSCNSRTDEFDVCWPLVPVPSNL